MPCTLGYLGPCVSVEWVDDSSPLLPGGQGGRGHGDRHAAVLGRRWGRLRLLLWGLRFRFNPTLLVVPVPGVAISVPSAAAATFPLLTLALTFPLAFLGSLFPILSTMDIFFADKIYKKKSLLIIASLIISIVPTIILPIFLI